MTSITAKVTTVRSWFGDHDVAAPQCHHAAVRPNVGREIDDLPTQGAPTHGRMGASVQSWRASDWKRYLTPESPGHSLDRGYQRTINAAIIAQKSMLAVAIVTAAERVDMRPAFLRIGSERQRGPR